MLIKRLQSGSLLPSEKEKDLTEVPASLKRRALLVYSGDFDSMDGPVAVKDEDIDKLVASHNGMLGKLKRMATGEMPLKACPPIQLDHSTSAKDTVGRLVGDLELGEHELDDGTKRKAVYGTVLMLGKENVEKAMDGRWTHLSVGADFEEGKLSELTITPFPAAKEASLLRSKLSAIEYQDRFKNLAKRFGAISITVGSGDHAATFASEQQATEFAITIEDDRFFKAVKHTKQSNGTVIVSVKNSDVDGYRLSDESTEGDRKPMEEKMKKHLMDAYKMSEEEAEKHMKHMGKKLMDEKKCASEDEAKKHLNEMPEADMKKMAEGAVEDVKKMAAEDAKKVEDEKKEKEAKMSRLSAAFKTFGEKKDSVKLKLRAGKISARLAELKACAKVTPAELKKIDIVKLAKENDQTIEAVLKTYADREPVALVGIYGSAKGVNLAAIKEDAMSDLEKETRLNMPLKAAELKGKEGATTRLQEGGEPAERETNIHIDTTPHVDMKGRLTALMKHLEEGKHEEAKAHLKKLMEEMAGMPEAMPAMTSEKAEELEAEVAKMSDALSEVQTLLAEVSGLKL